MRLKKEALQAGDKNKRPRKLAQLAEALCGAVASARLAVLHLVDLAENNNLREASAVSVPYLMMLGWLCGGWGVLKSAVAAESQAG